MTDDFEEDYQFSLDDFHSARRRAALDDILSRITRKSSRMLKYDEVRTQLGGLESANRKLKEIPLDSIVGTVGRYNDFNRKLLPLNKHDGERWIRVRRAVENAVGLPPIEVYQIGDAYFILDGHHRASIAREFGATHIQAYVREVVTRVPLSPTDQPEDMILKSEYTEFLRQTHIDELLPTTHLEVSIPGSYEKLLEHISVHRYFQGIDEKRPISYEEAIIHWYENVYQPVEQIIRQRNILKDFPGRTEADLYLWIMDHRSTLETQVGWKISPSKAASDLTIQFSPTFYNFFRRIASHLFDFVTPDPLELQPPAGLWRQQKSASEETAGLFDHILVAVTGDSAGWPAVVQAVEFARNEKSDLIGLHILRSKSSRGDRENQNQAIQQHFEQLCRNAGVLPEFISEPGQVTRTIYERSFWSDLLVLRLSYPPPILSFRRLGSGLRTIIRLVRTPMMVVPPTAPSPLTRVLLAYGGGRKADEALYMAAYLANRRQTDLIVVTVNRKGVDEHELVEKARNYLDSHNAANARYIEIKTGSPADGIVQVSEEAACDLILMGGYEGGYFRELIFGSTVDRVLQKTKCSVMICH
jgi:nucleotide-binding universal stress UspA family protein